MIHIISIIFLPIFALINKNNNLFTNKFSNKSIKKFTTINTTTTITTTTSITTTTTTTTTTSITTINNINNDINNNISNLTLELRKQHKDNKCDWFDPKIVGKFVLEYKIINYYAECKNKHNNFKIKWSHLVNDKPWSDAIGYCNIYNKSSDVYIEVKSKFIDPLSIDAFKYNKMTNMNIHGGDWKSFNDIIKSEKNGIDDGTYLQIFYYTLDLTDSECKTIHILKTVKTKTLSFYNNCLKYYGFTNKDNIVIIQNGKTSNIKVKYDRFPDITTPVDRYIYINN
jgi:hypothetical protein